MSASSLPMRRRDAVFARLSRVKNALSSKSPAPAAQAAVGAKVQQNSQSPRYDCIHEEAFEKFRTLQPQAAELLRTYIDPGRLANWHHDTAKFIAERQASAEEKRLKVRLSNGKTLVVRDVLGKFTKWVQMVVVVGDTAVQFDPVHAALPWAAFRFVLQSALNYHEADEVVWDGIERLCHELIWVNLQETLYLNSKASNTNLRKAFVAFYVELFTVLAAYLSRLDVSRGARLLLSPFVSKSSFQQLITSIDQKKQVIGDLSCQVTREAQLEQNTDIKQALDHLSDLQRPVDRLLIINELMYGKLEQGEHEKFLNWISDIQQADHYSRAISKALAGTGQWLFDSEQFIKWRTSSMAEILRFHGKAGSGKSTLFSVLLRRLKQESEADSLAPPVYFYCARTSEEPKRAQPLEILRCLLKQLSQPPGRNSIQQSVLQRYKQHSVRGELQEDEIVDLCLSCIETRGPTHILVDALDESDPTSRDILLGSLVRLLKESSQLVKIFVTSRDQRYESMILEHPELIVAPKDNIGDINLYIASELNRMENLRLVLGGRISADLRSHITESLSTNADGMFRWVALQLQTLKHFLEEDLMREHLGRLPADLSESYRHLFEFEIRHLERCLPGTKDIALRTFKWLMIAREQLSSDDFCRLVGHADASHSPKPRQHLLQYCFSLVEYDQATDAFRFCHLSVREFFESASFRSAYPEFEETRIQASVADICLGLTSERCSKDFPLPEYALVHWTHHARDAGEQRIAGGLSDCVRRFLSDNQVFDAWRALLCCLESGSWDRRPWPNYWPKDFAYVMQPLSVVVFSNFYELVPAFTENSSTSALTEMLYEECYEGIHPQCNVFECAAYEGHLKTLKALLDLERDRWAINRGADCAIAKACRHSRVKTFQFLLEEGPRYSLQYVNKHWAEYFYQGIKSTETVRLFLDHGADANYLGWYGKDPESDFVTPLMQCIYRVDTVKLLLAYGADVKIKDHNGEDALLKACKCYDMKPQTVAILLQHGADADTRDKSGRSALMAASSAGSEASVRLLLAAGADVDLVDDEGRSDLGFAERNVNVVQTLLGHRRYLGRHLSEEEIRSVSCAAAYSSSPCEAIDLLTSIFPGVNFTFDQDTLDAALVRAVRNGNVEAVNFLIEKGVAIEQPDTYLAFLAYSNICDIDDEIGVIRSRDVVRALLGAGIRLDYPRILPEVATWSCPQVVELLLDNGADVNSREQDGGDTALGNAAQVGDVETMKLLLARGADINAISGTNGSPLTRAVSNSHLSAINLLLESGADINLFCGGLNPLTNCAKLGRLEIAELLLDWGADIDAGGGKICTALIKAIQRVDCFHHEFRKDKFSFIRLLCRRGVDSTPKVLGFNALDYVSQNLKDFKDPEVLRHCGPARVAAAIEVQQEVAAILRNHGAETSESYARWLERRRRKAAEPFEMDGLDSFFDL